MRMTDLGNGVKAEYEGGVLVLWNNIDYAEMSVVRLTDAQWWMLCKFMESIECRCEEGKICEHCSMSVESGKEYPI